MTTGATEVAERTTASYTRVTLAGTRRRVDVVFPNDEPIGRLLPDVIRLTAEPSTSPPSRRYLAAVDGTLLDAGGTLADAGITDGTVLRVVGLADAPPPPVVHDVVDETADDLGRRPWRWDRRARHAVAIGLVAIVGLLVTHLVATATDDRVRAALLIVVPIVLLIFGAVGRVLPAPLGPALLLAAGAIGCYTVVTLVSGAGWTAIALAGVLAVCTIGLGLGTTLGRGGLIGGAVGLLLAAAWLVALLVGVEPKLVAAAAAVISGAALGVLPRLALMASGLTALDDRRSHDEEVRRPDVTTALTAAHRGLTSATVAVAVSSAAAGWVLGRYPDRWTLPLAGLLILVLVLRARSFPLLGSVLALASAALVTTVSAAIAWLSLDSDAVWPVVGAALTGVAVVFVALVAEPAEHTRARIRRSADRLEAVAVVVGVPLALGVSGLYSRLLGVF